MFEADALDGIGKLDVDREVVRVELQPVIIAKPAVFLHVHPERRDRAVTGQLPVAVLRRVRFEDDRGNRRGLHEAAPDGAKSVPMGVVYTAVIGSGETFNAAEYFIDRHIAEGRADAIALECEERRISYGLLADRVNRVGAALRARLSLRPEERVLLLMLDGPEMVFVFFGAIKIGAIPIPINTLWTTADYEFVLRDSRASVVFISSSLYPRLAGVLPRCPWVRHIVTVGAVNDGRRSSSRHSSNRIRPTLETEPTSRDAPAFWLYSSGSTGHPKGCVHLQHDMVVCADAYARGVLGIEASDRCFSVAKLFFAYGLGNAMYFPLAVGATAILWPGAVTPPIVYDLIERHRPTLFFSVPTHYAMLLAHQRESGEFDLSSIRCAVSAGEALPPSVFTRFRDRFGVEILDGIGSTEVLHIFISNRRGSARPGSSGIPVEGYDAKLVDEHGMPVAARRRRAAVSQGRLHLRGLLEPARTHQEHHRGPLDPHRRPLLPG